MSALAIVAISTVLVVSFRWFDLRNLYQLAEDRNVAQAYAFANALQEEDMAHLVAGVDMPRDVLKSHPMNYMLDEEFRMLTRNLPVLKVRVLSLNGSIIYSSAREDIGRSVADMPAFIQAIRSGLPVTQIRKRMDIASFGQAFHGRSIAETFVVVRNMDGRPYLVFELYADISAYLAQVERGIWSIMVALLSSLATLYVVLLLVVKRADKILAKQYAELQTFNARLEEKVDERTERLLNQQRVLSWVTRSDEFRSGNLEVAFGNLTRITAATLDVERVGIWVFSRDRHVLQCVDLFGSSLGIHSSGQTLQVDRYPSYFATVLAQDSLSIDDAQTDPRLSELADGYIKPLNIGSMLEVAIVHGGRTEGILCIEHVGSPLKWTAEQRLFALAIANFASLALERQERLRVEDDLREANRSVEAANRAKSLFLANMSHEIRTPMNGVFGMTDLLMGTELSERQKRFVGIISSSARRLLTIINDILDLSRIESGKFELDSHEFELRSSLEETVDVLAGEAQRKGLELNLVVGSDVPTVVKGDSGRLRQVLTNLINNAIKFTTEGEVVVKVSCDGISDSVARLCFEVRDSGIGIARDVQDRLFKPFQQADTSISRRFGGTGLGLSISRHLVELMGGTVALDSEPGRGTTVRVEIALPVVASHSDEQAAAHDPGVLRGCRVLVLDELGTNRELVQMYVREWGGEAVGVASPHEAFEELLRADFAGKRFALAIVDTVSPDAKGREFAGLVRGNTRLAETKLVMMTSMGWNGDAKVARELGFSTFLTKPVHRDDLLKVATRVIGRPAPRVGGEISSRKEPTGTVVPLAKAGGLRVLVAEDNPVNLEIAREYLEALGCTVVSAENGRLAAEAVRCSSFDLVLMDCQMPELDGLGATRLIRELELQEGRRRTVVVAVTADAFAEDKARCLDAGMDDYMSKPFSEKQLRELVQCWAPKGNPTMVASTDRPVQRDAVVSAAPEAAAKALDCKQLRQMQKTHPSLVVRLVETYLDFAPKAIQQMVAAVEARDIAQLRINAHSLKSSSANIGAMDLSGLCRELELRMKGATAWEDDANLASVILIEKSFQLVMAALGDLREELRAEEATRPRKATA